MMRSKSKSIIFLAPLLMLFIASSLYGEEDFIEIPITLIIGERQIGEIPARIAFVSQLPSVSDTNANPDRLFLRRVELYSYVGSLLNEETKDLLRDEKKGDYLSLLDIEETGLKVSYNEELLSITVTIPPELRPLNQIKMREAEKAVDPEEITTAPFSAFLNYRIAGGVNHYGYVSDDETLFPISLSLQPALQLYRWILESSMTFRNPLNGEEEVFTLNHLKLFHDFPKAAIRIEAGTLETKAGSIDGLRIGSAPLPGSPWGNKRGELGEEQTIIVEEPATLTVYLNGSLIRQERIEPGIHRLTEIPFTGGINKIKAVLRYSDGKEESFETEKAFDTKLLQPGSLTFSSYLGTPRFTFQDPLYGGELFYGLSKSISSGIEVQTDFTSILPTWNTILASPIGNFSFNLSSIFSPDHSPLMKTAFLYRLLLPGEKVAPTVGAGFSWQNSGYRESLLAPPGTVREYNLSLSLGLPLPGNFFLSAGGSFQFDPGFTQPQLTGSTTLLSRIGEAGSINLSNSFQYVPQEGDLQWSGSVTLIISPPGKKGGSIYSQDLTNAEASVALHGVINEAEEVNWSFGIDGYPPVNESTEIHGSMGGRTGFFNWTAGSNLLFYNDPALDARYSGGVNTAIAGSILFAGGLFGLSTPVEGSFALIRSDETVEDKLIAVRGSSISGSREKRGGTIVLSSLPAWKENTLFLDLPEAAPEEVLFEDRLTLLSVEKGGTVIRPGLRSSYYGSGYLVDLDGLPIALTAATVVPLDVIDSEGILIFTDESGRFQFHHLEQGEYLLTLLNSKRAQIEFSLAPGLKNPIDLQNLILPILEKNYEKP